MVDRKVETWGQGRKLTTTTKLLVGLHSGLAVSQDAGLETSGGESPLGIVERCLSTGSITTTRATLIRKW